MRSWYQRNKIVITLLPVLAVMGLIFAFSAQEAVRSDHSSGVFVSAILELVVRLFPDLDGARQQAMAERLSFLVRKGAHLTEYAVLGAFLAVHVSAWTERRPLRRPRTLAFSVGALYAASDELHQLFVPGRSGDWKDVLLDSAGVLIGVLLLARILRRRRAKPGKDGTPTPSSS